MFKVRQTLILSLLLALEELRSEVEGIRTDTFDNSVRVDRNQNVYLTFSCSK